LPAVPPLGRALARRLAAAWLLPAAGAAAAVVAVVLDAAAARAAAAQDWPPFVLVTGLLLVGVVAAEDGLFAAVGRRLAGLARHELVVFAGSVVLVAVVTALLNLDTSVAFLTPVLVYMARHRGRSEDRYLYACLLLSNAGSVLLPGSNLTNLIVVGRLHLSGGHFFVRMAPVWLAAVAVTAAVAAVLVPAGPTEARVPPDQVGLRFGPGVLAAAAVTVIVLVDPAPALPVLGIGMAAAAVLVASGHKHPRQLLRVLGLPILIGLYGVAVGLGAAGRAWSEPASFLQHLDRWSTAGLAAGASLVANNLPAASLLAARPPTHPFAMLVGLDLGPNLFATGSLAWLLWRQAARTAGARPSISRASRVGVVAGLLGMAAALAVLSARGLP
jgi:arsenical pump membrane protein